MHLHDIGGAASLVLDLSRSIVSMDTRQNCTAFHGLNILIYWKNFSGTSCGTEANFYCPRQSGLFH